MCELALDLDTAGLQHLGFVGVVLRLQHDFAAGAAEPFERDFLIIHQRDDDRPVLGGFAAADDDDVLVVDARIDHRIPADM